MLCRFYIGQNLIEIWEDTQTIRTTFSDGTQLVAAPQDNDDYRRRAKEFGFKDTWEFCKSHEILHTAIAVGQGRNHSRGLRRAAKNQPPDNMDYFEEAHVLKLQKLEK